MIVGHHLGYAAIRSSGAILTVISPCGVSAEPMPEWAVRLHTEMSLYGAVICGLPGVLADSFHHTRLLLSARCKNLRRS